MSATLTEAQRATLKTFVQTTNNADVVAARLAGASFELAQVLNAAVSPPQAGWRFIPKDVVLANLRPAEVDNLFAASKGPALDFLMKHSEGIDCTTPDGPKVITDILSQTNPAAPLSRAAMLQVATEPVTLAQSQTPTASGVAPIGGTLVTSATPPAATVTALLRNFTGKVSQADCNGFLAV